MPVYKDKKRNTWYVRLSIVDPITHKRSQPCKRGFKTKREALEWEASQLTSKPSHTSATFDDLFEENLKFLNSSETSASMKRSWIRKHFPYHSDPIEKISKPMLIEWRNSLADSKLSVRTRNRGMGYVKSVFSYASDVYAIPNNGAVIRSYKLTKKEKTEMPVWTPEEFRQFIDCVPEGYYKTYFTFLYWTGVRRSEGLAVCKEDIVGNKVHIYRSIKHFKNGFLPLKTDTSERWILLDDDTLKKISKYLDSPGQFVFGGDRSLPITNVQLEFTEAIKKSGVKKIRIHDLRHSHATLLINNGANIVAVSKRLGHASINQTLRTYAHLLHETDEETVNLISKIKEK